MGKVKCIYCHKLPKEWICISSRLKKMYCYKCPMCGMSTRKRKTREKALKEWNKTNGGLLGKLMEVNYKLCHDTIIFHPAYYLNEIREHYNMSKEAFATDIAVRSKASDTETENRVSDKILKLLNGEIGIDDEIGQCLEDYFGISKEYWLNMQKKYDYDISLHFHTTTHDTSI